MSFKSWFLREIWCGYQVRCRPVFRIEWVHTSGMPENLRILNIAVRQYTVVDVFRRYMEFQVWSFTWAPSIPKRESSPRNPARYSSCQATVGPSIFWLLQIKLTSTTTRERSVWSMTDRMSATCVLRTGYLRQTRMYSVPVSSNGRPPCLLGIGLCRTLKFGQTKFSTFRV